MTQSHLAEAAEVTQAALSRYENGLRDPSPESLVAIAEALGVTPEFLQQSSRVFGAAAIDAHMRRRATAKASDWRRLEAQLNMYRLHLRWLFDEIPMHIETTVPRLDPFEVDAHEAARLFRMQLRIPAGPVEHLVQWIESAGCLVIEEDFGTSRVDGLSQWIDDYPVILVNTKSPVDRKRLTIAHELGHLVLHSVDVSDEIESEANSFAAELLMPSETIRPQLRNLTLGRLQDLKRVWLVSMQALIERAYHLGVLPAKKRTSLYKQISSRGWRKNEPGSQLLPPETPRLAPQIGHALIERGLTYEELAYLTGYIDPEQNPFNPPRRHLRLT